MSIPDDTPISEIPWEKLSRQQQADIIRLKIAALKLGKLTEEDLIAIRHKRKNPRAPEDFADFARRVGKGNTPASSLESLAAALRGEKKRKVSVLTRTQAKVLKDLVRHIETRGWPTQQEFISTYGHNAATVSKALKSAGITMAKGRTGPKKDKPGQS